MRLADSLKNATPTHPLIYSRGLSDAEAKHLSSTDSAYLAQSKLTRLHEFGRFGGGKYTEIKGRSNGEDGALDTLRYMSCQFRRMMDPGYKYIGLASLSDDGNTYLAMGTKYTDNATKIGGATCGYKNGECSEKAPEPAPTPSPQPDDEGANNNGTDDEEEEEGENGVTPNAECPDGYSETSNETIPGDYSAQRTVFFNEYLFNWSRDDYPRKCLKPSGCGYSKRSRGSLSSRSGFTKTTDWTFCDGHKVQYVVKIPIN